MQESLFNDIQPNDLRQPPLQQCSVVGSTVILGDCVQLMKGYADNYFDLAIVDPPYGIGVSSQDNTKRGKLGSHYEKKEWDKEPPSNEYFEQLFRISKNQVIWGANHFIERINKNSSCWLVWNKKTVGNTADCELAWTSFKTAVRRFDFMWEGFWQENMKDKEKRIHPTQKPVALYDWILHNYAKEGDLILDTHLGSGSSRIASDKAGLDFTGIEIDKEYFDLSEKRFKQYKSQLRIEGW